MFLKNKKEKKPQIEYWSSIAGLSEIDEIKPKPFREAAPSWWSDIPSDFNNSKFKTAKNCPSFMDIFSSAYVIPMWCDTQITISDSEIYWNTPSSEYQWEFHENDQFLKYSPSWINQRAKIIMKAISPWYAKTPTGYSIYQMPVFYDFNKDFVALPGIIHTDIYHFMNAPIMIFSDKQTLLIKRGTPLFIHFPFKRNRFELIVREKNQNDIAKEGKSNEIIRTKFISGYRSITKNYL